jgi:DNA primase
MNVRVVMLPDGEDPDSFSRTHSSSEFLDFIAANEKDFISFKTGILQADTLNDPIKKAQLVTDIVRSVSVIPDGILRSIYLKECSLILEVEEQVLYNEVNKIRRIRQEQKWQREHNRNRGNEQIVPVTTSLPRQPLVPGFVENIYSEIEEREIIYFLLKFGNRNFQVTGEDEGDLSVARFIIREIQNDELEFTNLVYKQVFEDVSRLIEQEEELTERYFIYHDNPSIRELAVDIFTSRYELSKVWKRKEAYVELPGENLDYEVPRSLLSYKMMVVEKALTGLRKELEGFEKIRDLENLNQVLVRIRSLEQVKKALSTGLGGRIIIH